MSHPSSVLVGEAGSRSEVDEPATEEFNYMIGIGSRSGASLELDHPMSRTKLYIIKK